MPKVGRSGQYEDGPLHVSDHDDDDYLLALAPGLVRGVRGSSSAVHAAEERSLASIAVTEAAILGACLVNPCNHLDFCIVYNEQVHCSCPNGLGYVQYGQTNCPSSPFLDGHVPDAADNNNNKMQIDGFEPSFFINVTSSRELCEPNPCAQNAECIPFDEPYCLCHNSYMPFGRSIWHVNEACSAAKNQSVPTAADATDSNMTSPSSLEEGWYILIAVVALLFIVVILSWKEPARIAGQHNPRQQQKSVPFGEDDADIGKLTADEDDGSPQISHREHLLDTIKLFGSITIMEIFQHGMHLVDVAFVGHLGQDAIGALALFSAWFDLWEAFMIGGMTAIDTALAQSFGASDMLAFRTVAGNSLIVTQIATVIVACLLALIEPTMKLIGQDPDLAHLAATFSYRVIPGLFPLFAFRHLIKYLQNQDIMLPGVLIGPLANGLNVVLNWLLIFEFDLGFHGAAWATTLSRFAQLIMILGYLFWNKNTLLRSTWPTISVSTWKSFVSANIELLKLAGSGAIGEAAIFWALDLSIFFAGYLGAVQLGAYNLVLTIDYVMYMIFAESIQVAVSIRVGQLIGSGNASGARRFGTVSFFVSGVTHISLGTFVYVNRVWISELLTSDPEVAAVVVSLMPIQFVLFVAVSMEPVALGILRGLGQQFNYMAFGIIGHWVVGVPVSLVLAFVVGLEVNGLIWGITIGSYVTALIGIVFLKCRVDWIEEKQKAQELVTTFRRPT